MKIFQEIKNSNHEQIIYCADKGSALKAIIAIHNTALGPSLEDAECGITTVKMLL